MSEPFVLSFEPILKPKVWGGSNLDRLFGLRLPESQAGGLGEAWLCCDMPEGRSPVRGTDHTLTDFVQEWGDGLLGGIELFEGSFPLLLKLLDANDDLSVQVHPDEAMARRMGVRLKHEAWYIVEARGDAVIYRGLHAEVTPDRLAEACRTGQVAGLLKRIVVSPGECYYLPSGTLHALGAGVVVAEIQTPSDVTYRLFDWNRLGTDGKPRELHVEAGLEATHFGPQPPNPFTAPPNPRWPGARRLVACPSFVADEVALPAGAAQRSVAEMLTWIVLAGGVRLSDGRGGWLDVAPGRACVVPAALGTLRVEASAGGARLIEVTGPRHGD